MVTTRSEADRVDAAFDLGCTDYVTKPIDQSTCLRRSVTSSPRGSASMAEGRHAAYVRRVQQDAQRCAEALLADNERLRKQVALLENGRIDFERRLREAEDGATIAEALRALAASLEAETLRLRQRVADLEGSSSAPARVAPPRTTARRHRSRQRRAVEEYTEVQQRVANLANLYVASYQLHDTLDRYTYSARYARSW